MAARLTVIMIESAPPTAAAGRLADDIVGNLIGRPGIDMTLVRSLSGLEESSTDRLTLEAITTDVAVLDWQSPQSIVNGLNAVGFDGRRSPHPLDTESLAAPAGIRRIYAFDLTRISDSADLIQALQTLKSEREVRTFTIGTLTNSQSPGRGQSKTLPSQSKPLPSKQPSISKEETVREPPEHVPKPAAIDLDDLIDQLDRLDT